jgi:hypothetical protein
MSITYTLDLNYTSANLANKDFVDNVLETIWDLTPADAVYSHNFSADFVAPLEIVMKRGEMSAEDLADLTAELQQMPLAFVA